MTAAQWTAEVSRRIKGYEALRLYKYKDDNDVTTFGWGYAIQSAATDQQNFAKCGLDYAVVMAAPTAPDSAPENAVAACLTAAQADALFALILPGYINDARGSLPEGIFDALTDARRFVIVDLCYNMGLAGWNEFVNTKSNLVRAQQQKNQGHGDTAAQLFHVAGDDLAASLWYKQTGLRAINDVAMIRTSDWSPPVAA